MSDGPPAPAGSAEGGPLGEDQGTEPGAGPRAAAPPTKRELGLATATVVVGFAILVACLLVFGTVAEGVRVAGRLRCSTRGRPRSSTGCRRPPWTWR